MCKTINIVSIKGGCGKTTTTINLCTALSNSGKKILSSIKNRTKS